MTYSVYQHWDPLKTCIVGRSYPPEFYSWIKVSHVRDLFEKIAIETEEDFQLIIKKLEEFKVKVLRPNIPEIDPTQAEFAKPPMTPRDHFVMIGEIFYTPGTLWNAFYQRIKDDSWPDYIDFDNMPKWMQTECLDIHGYVHLDHEPSYHWKDSYSNIIDHITQQGNNTRISPPGINGAMVSRIGKDLYFGTDSYSDYMNNFFNVDLLNKIFPKYRNHIVNTGGHSDGTYCPVTPGLIISLRDVPTYADTYPDWEVIYLPNQSWSKVKPFLDLKKVNGGKWWIPGFEYDQAVIDTVTSWLDHWTGYVEETVFDVNMLIIDPKNVMVFNYDQKVFDALDRYGITAHVVPFRHRYFWDGGIHCVTCDLDREGSMQDYFPERG